MKHQISKIAFIIILFKTPKKEVDRLKKEINDLGCRNKELYFIDNTKTGRGYAEGVNKGIRRGLKEKVDLFILMNPDISLSNNLNNLTRYLDFLDGSKYFDIWGYTMKQKGKTYYGGEIDPWKMSGGMITHPPMNRFIGVDFISGSLMCIKKKVIEKVGFFDESYFMYYEDVDYCVRAKKAEFKVGVDTHIIYEHFESPMIGYDREQLLDKARLIFFKRYSSIPQKIYEIIYRLLHSNFLLNFFSLNIASLIIKLTSFVNFLFLVKYLTAPEYGIYTLVWTQVTILSPLADFGTTSYGVVYLPTEKEKKYESLYSFRIFVSSFIFLGTVLLSLLLFKGSTKMYGYILVTATVIFTNMFSGSYFILNALKNKIYRSSRNSIIFNILLVAAIIISLVTFKRLLAVFIIIFVFYNTYSVVNLFLIKREIPKFRFTFNFKGWAEIFKNLYVFVLISFFAGLYAHLDVFLLKMLKGETEVGIYSAGSKFLEALLFIAASYNVTAAPILARLTSNADSLKRKITKDFIFLSVIGFGTALFLFLFSPYLLTTIFKKNYLLAIPVLRIVIFSLPFILFNSIWLNVLYVLKKSYLAVFVFLFQTLINLALNIIFIPRYSYIASSYITVFSEIMNCVVLVILVRYVWKKKYYNNEPVEL